MKKQLGPANCLYPSLTVLAGANVNGKPNFLTIAHVGIMTLGEISLGINKSHYTNSGIKENKTFSVNIPSQDLVRETDYCGIMTGKNTDKASLFEVFYGELKTAPMIQGCPVNMECELVRTVDFPSHDVFVGRVMASYCDENVLTGGALDLSKVRPLLFDMATKQYFALGAPVAKCWSIGKECKTR